MIGRLDAIEHVSGWGRRNGLHSVRRNEHGNKSVVETVKRSRLAGRDVGYFVLPMESLKLGELRERRSIQYVVRDSRVTRKLVSET